MKPITLHKINKTLDSQIRRRAKKEKKSLNRTIQDMLEEVTGIKKQITRDDFNEFLGLWNEKEYKEFNKSVSEFKKINKADWE